MGRRKIEIKPIKDDRNRSVTFLKRKGGLFKKAHELSVLCQVDVAVIIFGQNKKLYQYSSGDIREVITRHSYYPKAHEHKTPADFADKGADDDDESEDVGGSEVLEEITPPIHATPGHPYPNHPQYQQIQHAQSPSPSPPMQQNMFQPQRLSVSQGGSRPTSRVGMHVRRTSSNLVPQDHPHPQAQQPQQMQYGYAPQYSAYQHMPPTNAQMQMYQQQQQHQAQIQQQQQQHPGHYSNPVPLHGQLQQMYLEEEQRRQSLPPAFAMQIDGDDEEGAQAMHQMIPPQRPQRSWQSPPPASDPRAIHGHKRTAQNSFTPVDENRSMLAQHWPEQHYHNLPQHGHGGEYLSVRHEVGTRSQSIDVGSAMRNRDYGALQLASFHPGGGPGMRTVSVSAMGGGGGGGGGAHMRNNSLQDLKRPRLTVQIPGEREVPDTKTAGGRQSGTTESAESSAQGSGSGSATAGPGAGGGGGVGGGAGGGGVGGGGNGGSRAAFTTGTRPRGASNSVVLPPPSPSIKSPSSASGVLSAGATGPQNPFARPPPPQNNNMQAGPGSATQAFPGGGGGGYGRNGEADTPLSALPSRFMSGELLPSPSQFYGDWGFGQGGQLASPAGYQATPLTAQGPGWREDDVKRRTEEGGEK